MKSLQTFKLKKALIISVFILFYANNAISQCQIENLVFEGAGIRGIAYAGVIEELEKQGKLKHINKVGGTSAGAITALMISLGYSSSEIESIITSTKFKKFNDGRFIFFGAFIRLNKKYGWYRGEKFNDWIGKLIKEKTGDPEITFEELK